MVRMFQRARGPGETEAPVEPDWLREAREIRSNKQG
jgi:hypothetical protein